MKTKQAIQAKMAHLEDYILDLKKDMKEAESELKSLKVQLKDILNDSQLDWLEEV